MEISEKKIEDLITEAIENNREDLLENRGLADLCLYKGFFRQFDLGSYGRMDLVLYDFPYNYNSYGQWKTIRIEVVEIKKGEVNYNTLAQAVRYCKGLENLLNPYSKFLSIEFSITLIGSSISTSDFCYFPDVFENLNIYTIDLDWEHGITFKKQSGYQISNPQKVSIKLDDLKKIKKVLRSAIRFAVDNNYNPKDGLPF